MKFPGDVTQNLANSRVIMQIVISSRETSKFRGFKYKNPLNRFTVRVLDRILVGEIAAGGRFVFVEHKFVTQSEKYWFQFGFP
jgi:hypothetical protein